MFTVDLLLSPILEVTVSDEVYKIMRGQLIECMKRNRRFNATNEDASCPAVFDGYKRNFESSSFPV